MSADAGHLGFLAEADLYAERFGWATLPMRWDRNGRKAPACNWEEFKRRPPDADERRRLFRAQECIIIGLLAILGPPSQEAYSRDFDYALAYWAWADAHPEGARALPTIATHRGYSIVGYSDCRIKYTEFPDGELAGEGHLRALPTSQHPSGDWVYRWIVPPKPRGLDTTVNPRDIGLDRPWADPSLICPERGDTEIQSNRNTEPLCTPPHRVSLSVSQ